LNALRLGISKVADVSYKTIYGREITMQNLMKRLWQEEEGQDLVEYGLLLVLVALVAVASISTIGSAVSKIFSNAASVTTSASS
jgi:pilus assembly protein Flp/PilA